MSDDRNRGKGRRSGGVTVVKYLIVLILLAAAAAIWFYLRPPVPPPPVASVLPVETIQPILGSLDQKITLDSHVGSDSVVTVFPKVSGNLISLNAEVGRVLNSGEVIAKIDPEPYRIAADQAKAVYDGAKSTYDRQKQLYASGATSQQNYDRARTQYENARSQYELAKLHLSYTTITSPVDGAIILRDVSNGALVSQSVPIVTISNTHALVAKADVPESYARLFEENGSTMPISASIPAMGTQTYPLRIRTITPAIDVTTKTFTVECEFEGNTKGIMPGMFARVTFVLDRRENIPYLPYAVLVGGNTLWYVASDGSAQYLTFTPTYHNDNYFELPEKYKNYTFILSGQHFLSAGTTVQATPANQGTK